MPTSTASNNWNAEKDMSLWEEIAIEAHSRHSRKTSAYISFQTIVEERAHKIVAERARGAARVLEIGVGGGEHLVYRHPDAGSERYVGLDLSPEYAQICHEKFGIEVACCDAADMPFADEEFDCVVAVSILEHVERLDDTLAAVRRVLKPGGHFHIVVPTNGSIAINTFKAVMTYPTMRRRGIERPDLVWHRLNVNSFKRIRATVNSHFTCVRETGVPMPFMPWWMAPLMVFEARK